ncbi:conserved Plasmodium protein, unknown function [Plasmodium berghei]|uniref:HRDC domain-containing protein n=2 Tax=Plasmodium berghei TaxID=5821 RepID=A0A509AN49_PLABA|nr:conserved Plasmodium protein, unknown function [Plasmodium berghei ANKA]CXI54110.1 conserved Plasmodium protein, unknown function [Plasmodium berghei]SCL94906.1 conserved Plasmodium protein, unknown function [Plasmodium berghei]SCM16131.1 conserved Plasmodium protein, unknown function [Plasmodium berghei]SCM17927.1 conserved Plasmodium protein, unknown function [Plasmodium berghei]SCN26281.1 conserved Plasmodium protein, unknown function [Plasmodium berghei]|eukprot:XP_034422055.1 conserved Plasmodium protein, unknown function [Plasmodium berghei ANKA]
MKKVNIINNLDEQIKSLNDNNIPQKYCTPSNNINIQNYLKENNIKYKHPSNVYLGLNGLLRFVDSLNPLENYSFNHGNIYLENERNGTINSKPNKNEHIYNDQNLFQHTSNNNFLRNNPCEKTYYTKTNYGNNDNYKNYNTYQEYNNRHNNSNYKNSIFYEDNNKYDKNQNNSYICLDNDNPQKFSEIYDSRNALSHKRDQGHTPIDHKQTIVSDNKKNNENSVLKCLFECRDNMAKWDNMNDPEKLITTKNLKLLLLHSPKTIDDMKNLNLIGFGEDKIQKYGFEFLKILLSR